MATHAAYSILEFHDIVREHQMTPIELLDKVGMLRTTLNIGHGQSHRRQQQFELFRRSRSPS